MQWENSSTAGFTTGKPWEAPDASVATANVAAEENDPNSLLNFYRQLIKIRRESPALSSGNWALLSSDKDGVVAFLRQSPQETMLVALNFNSKEVENPALSLDKSELNAGQYSGQELLQGAAITGITVGEGGALKGIIPLNKLEPHKGYIIKLSGSK
jgi:glycosidase